MTRSSSVLLNVLGAFEATYNKAKRRFNNMVRIHCGGAARRLMTVPSHPCCHAMRIHPHLRAGHQLCHGAAPILAARPVWYVYVTASFNPLQRSEGTGDCADGCLAAGSFIVYDDAPFVNLRDCANVSTHPRHDPR